jgi:beta-mannosidase
LYRDGRLYGAPVCVPIAAAGRGHRSVHADVLFGGFRDLTAAYQFGPGGHDVVAATLKLAGSATAAATACFVPRTLPAERVGDLGLTARAEPVRGGYVLVVETLKFAHAVAVDVDGWMPDDNYFHVEPGEPKRIALRSTNGAVAPRGRVSALNGPGSIPFAIMDPIDAHG